MILLAVYVGALALTVALRADHVRPLYDGFAPPTPYRWVDPPPFFASGNVEPAPRSASIRMGAAGSAAAGVATPDGQFVINLARGAVAPKAGARHVAVKITPIAPDALPPVPGGLRANGNAYRVEITYEPSGDPVRRLVRPGSLVIEIPELGDALFASGGGPGWSTVDARALPPRELSLTAELDRPGTYLGATNLPETPAPAGESPDHSVAIGIATAALTVILLVGAFLLVVRRRRRATVPVDHA